MSEEPEGTTGPERKTLTLNSKTTGERWLEVLWQPLQPPAARTVPPDQVLGTSSFLAAWPQTKVVQEASDSQVQTDASSWFLTQACWLLIKVLVPDLLVPDSGRWFLTRRWSQFLTRRFLTRAKLVPDSQSESVPDSLVPDSTGGSRLEPQSQIICCTQS